jgi:hypothetical protein
MIVDGLLSVVFGLIQILLIPLELAEFAVTLATFDPVAQYFRMALYLIPFAELMPIFTFFIGMMAFRIIVSLIKTIWNLLPIL